MNLSDLLGRLGRDLHELYGPRYRGLVLFGSHARGTADEGSDIDLLLLLDGPVNTTVEMLRIEPITWPLSLEEDLALAVFPVSEQDYLAGGSLFLRLARREGIRAA